MIRLLGFLTLACWAGGLLLLITADGESSVSVPGIAMIAVALLLTFGLWLRRTYYRVRGLATDARFLIAGDVEDARVVSVGKPQGRWRPSSEVTVELKGADGHIHSIQRELRMPIGFGWVMRFAQRLSLPMPVGVQPPRADDGDGDAPEREK